MTGGETSGRRVVVGVAPSKAGRAAVTWALAHAERNGAALELVRVTRSASEREAWMLDEALAQIGRTNVAVRGLLVPGHPERELRRAGVGAELLVLGAAASRRGTPRPSVTADCLRLPPCRVVALNADMTVAALARFELPGAC
jgi:nucleotide-binding universal stress UspA family protein